LGHGELLCEQSFPNAVDKLEESVELLWSINKK